MKAVVFHGIGDIRLDDVSEPHIKAENDAIVALTASAICGTDLHMVRGTLSGMQKGTIPPPHSFISRVEVPPSWTTAPAGPDLAHAGATPPLSRAHRAVFVPDNRSP
jgi:threonine dehydrogenase-like Zn-dependent dehydrogenase